MNELPGNFPDESSINSSFQESTGNSQPKISSEEPTFQVIKQSKGSFSKVVIIGLLPIIMALLGVIAYLLIQGAERESLQQTSRSNQVIVSPPITQVPPSPSPGLGKCAEGFYPYQAQAFTLCVPQRFEPKEGMMARDQLGYFADETTRETIGLYSLFEGGWGRGCVTEEEITYLGQQGTQMTLRSVTDLEDGTSECGGINVLKASLPPGSSQALIMSSAANDLDPQEFNQIRDSLQFFEVASSTTP